MNYVNGSVGAKGAREAQANSNFYANIGVNAGFTRSRSNTTSHTESAVVMTMQPMNENSSITYNNVNNITYQGTQAQGGTFIYNNVANIQKEAVELRNRYSSESSGFGVGVSAGIGSNGQIKSNGISGNISANRSNQNTDETLHQNGSFTNVNEVHNNTGTMTLSGFNQEGGKVTGNIGKVEVVSRQNTSTTTGSSKGVNLGISANGVPSSVNINGSRTNGNRAFVDNQSTFVVGEGSNLHVGTVENTGAVIGKEGNSTFKIDTYVGKDIQNYDTMTTTGGSIGVSLGGNPKITNVGFNQDSRDKQGITRNTVVGDVEIAEAEGSPINRDLGKANEVTKDTHSRTNINVEPQVIEYLTNPGKLKEDIGKAKDEIEAVGAVAKAAFNTIGSKEKNSFLDFLRTERVQETVRNLGYIDTEGKTKEQIAQEMQDKYGEIFAKNGKKLEINFYVNSEVSQDDPNAKNKMNAAGFVAEDGSIWLNADNISSVSNFNLNSVFGHELTHNVTGKDTELLANFGEARASGFIEKAMDKGYLARTGGGLNWNSETLTKEQKDRLASYQDIEEKLKISNYLRIYRSAKQGEVVHSAEDDFIEVGKDMNLISKLEKEIQDKLGIKSYNLPDSIKSLDLQGKKSLAENVTKALENELQNELTDLKNASGDNKKKIEEEIIQKYGISNSDLATAEKNVSEIIKGTILKSSNAENNLKEILNNKNLTDNEKIVEINRKFGISVTINDLKNNSQISQEIIKNASLERIVAQDTDRIANKMRWESQFFKDFYANTQKLTNRPLVIDEDDFVWYAGNDGKLSSSQIVWEKGKVKSPSAKHSITGKVAFINENYMYKGEDKAAILDSWNGEPEVKNSNEIFDTKVWKGKNYTSENNLIERVIKDQHTIFVRNTPGDAYVDPVSPNDAKIKNGIEGKGSDSILGIDYHIDAPYKVYDGIDKKTGLIKVRDQEEKAIPYVVYGHEVNHGSHNQEGINEALTPHYQIYRDGNGIHFSGERKFEVSVSTDSLDDFYNEIINDLKNKNFTAYNKEGKIDTVHSEILKKLEDKNSDYYKFFRIELEEKMNKAKKNSQTTVNLNIPFFDYPTNKEEINTTGIKGSKYEKSSTPNSTEVKIMINHGKENLKRGVY